MKNKYKKGPIPMKFRAFPKSFWQQPNKTPTTSPGNVYFIEDACLNKYDIPATGGVAMEEIATEIKHEEVTQPNIDLLFSLFRSVEEDQQNTLGCNRNVRVIRRGRPTKLRTPFKVIRNDDPYLPSNATESLVPLLSKADSGTKTQNTWENNTQILTLISVGAASPSLLTANDSKNYSKILSDLVVQL